MKMKHLSVYALLLMIAVPLSIHAASAKRRPGTSRRVPAARQANNALQEMLRRTQEIAEAAQSEARRAQAQNEELQKRLEANTRELTQLRQTMVEFGVRIAELKSDKSDPKPALTHIQPEQPAQPAHRQ